MADAERNYDIYDQEMLAIIRALEDWRHYLEGLPEPFKIITDHQNRRTSQNLTWRRARWSIWLSRFNFFLTHKPRKTNTRADLLSCIPSLQVTDEEDNQVQIVLKPEWFAKISANQTEVVTPLEGSSSSSKHAQSRSTSRAESLERAWAA